MVSSESHSYIDTVYDKLYQLTGKTAQKMNDINPKINLIKLLR